MQSQLLNLGLSLRVHAFSMLKFWFVSLELDVCIFKNLHVQVQSTTLHRRFDLNCQDVFAVN